MGSYGCVANNAMDDLLTTRYNRSIFALFYASFIKKESVDCGSGFFFQNSDKIMDVLNFQRM